MLVLAGLLALVRQGQPDPLVVYCAHDAVYADAVLKDFEKKTGIPLEVRYDSEATKSLGLTNMLIQEKDAPRADVFWNNQLLGTLDLQANDVLAPYQGSGYERIPEGMKDPGGLWTGFGARLRVFIINTNKLDATPAAVRSELSEPDLSDVAIAKPLFGTTLTHYSVLWHAWGGDAVQAWHKNWRERGLVERGGNSQTKDLTASGVTKVGFTDTDDYYVAEDSGLPVAMLPIRVSDNPADVYPEEGRVICIPNTVSIIKGSNNREAAEQLVDYLLSEEVELRLAQSTARQIPLGPVDETKLPEEVIMLRQWSKNAYPLTGLHEARQACMQWLKSEYVQ